MSGAAAQAYGLRQRRLAGRVAGGGIALAVLLLGDLLVGPAFLHPADVLATLFGGGNAADPALHAIVWSIRLPMSLMAVVVGMALGLAGALMQTILGNPLASPYTLGLSAAAGFGASVTILTGFSLPVLPQLTVPLAAFVAAAGASLSVAALARLRGVTPEVMVLAGIAILFLFQSLQSLSQYLAAPEVLQQIVFWLFGSMLKASWTGIWIAASLCVVAVLPLLGDLWKLTAMRLGDDRLASLGVDPARLRVKVFLSVSLLTTAAVAFVGTIGFVGLVAPHIARWATGEDHRLLLPMSALSGAGLLVAASILSKLIAPGAVVPIGIVTAIVGVPFLFGLILKSRSRFW
ncbi:MAG: iron ABC transporter permease [Pseudomonadota bacterium]|nr:iron ABC transporter permease [Pseudomonadota bacterium]